MPVSPLNKKLVSWGASLTITLVSCIKVSIDIFQGKLRNPLFGNVSGTFCKKKKMKDFEMTHCSYQAKVRIQDRSWKGNLRRIESTGKSSKFNFGHIRIGIKKGSWTILQRKLLVFIPLLLLLLLLILICFECLDVTVRGRSGIQSLAILSFLR